MKKLVLLIGFLMIGMITFANTNTIPTNNLLQTASVTVSETVNSNVNNVNVDQPTETTGQVVIRTVNVNELANSCTVTADVELGTGPVKVQATVSATADTCKEAAAMILAMFE